MLKEDVTTEENEAALASLRKDGIEPPLCWGPNCDEPANWLFPSAEFEGIYCPTHFNELLRKIN